MKTANIKRRLCCRSKIKLKNMSGLWKRKPLLIFVRPHPDLRPSVFAALRRDRAGAEGEGGQEKEQPLAGFGFADSRPANPVAGFSKDAAKISPSPPTELGERAGVARSTNFAGATECSAGRPAVRPCQFHNPQSGFLGSVPDVSAKLKSPNTNEEKFEDVVKSAQAAAVLVLVY